DLLDRLVDGVVHFLKVDLGNDVKRVVGGHGRELITASVPTATGRRWCEINSPPLRQLVKGSGMPLLTEPGQTPSPPLSAAAAPEAGGRLRVRLGDELPIFCEKCGYSLHRLPLVRCEMVAVIHYVFPEFSDIQPIKYLLSR